MNLLTVPEVARTLRCAAGTVRAEIRAGNLVATKPNGRWLVRPDDLDRYLKASANVQRRAS